MSLPKITIVTPSYNQGEYIEETILSISQQNYENLEYIVIDGGSDDQTPEILKKHSNLLSWWVSEPDDGQTHALNKGFSKSTGEIMAYLNADDKYCPWTLSTVSSIFTSFPEIQWITSLKPIIWDASGNIVLENILDGFSKQSFYAGKTLGNSAQHIGWIQQESTFWRRELWEKAGSNFVEELHYAMDFDLWARFFEHENLVGVPLPLGGFRIHEEQKSSQINNYYDEAHKILNRYSSPNTYSNECVIVNFDLSSKSWQLNKQANFCTKKNLLQQKNSHIENLKNEKSQLDNTVNNLKSSINRMENTLSWKVTKPLRKVVSHFK